MTRPPLAFPSLGALALLSAGALATPDWKLESADGTSSIKFGYLAVMRADSVEQAAGDDLENLYFRRLRFLAGGKLDDDWSFFFETDSPNLGKSDAAGVKTAGDMYVQDFFVTYSETPTVKIDLGLLLIPLSRNGTQSAASHLASDYGPYSFPNSAPTKSRVGRDYGVQVRGAVADQRLEYRLGLFDGDRATGDLRVAARAAYNFFDTETGMFYTGTNLGKKRQLAVGVGVDMQDDYQATAFDVFWDQPVGDDGSALTLQADLVSWDGGDTFAALPEQDTLLVEAGYLIGDTKVQPWVQFATRDFADGATADTDQLLVGFNYRIAGHNKVLRFAYGQNGVDGDPDTDTIQVTLQLFQY